MNATLKFSNCILEVRKKTYIFEKGKWSGQSFIGEGGCHSGISTGDGLKERQGHLSGEGSSIFLPWSAASETSTSYLSQGCSWGRCSCIPCWWEWKENGSCFPFYLASRKLSALISGLLCICLALVLLPWLSYTLIFVTCLTFPPTIIYIFRYNALE